MLASRFDNNIFVNLIGRWTDDNGGVRGYPTGGERMLDLCHLQSTVIRLHLTQALKTTVIHINIA